MHSAPMLTLPPPQVLPLRVVYLDRLGVELTHIGQHLDTPIVGLRELRGTSHPVPAVIVRKGDVQ